MGTGIVEIRGDGDARLTVVVFKDLEYYFIVRESALAHLEKWWAKQEPGKGNYTLDLSLDSVEVHEATPTGILKRVATLIRKLVSVIHEIDDKNKQDAVRLELDDHLEDNVEKSFSLRELFLLTYYQPSLAPSKQLEAIMQMPVQKVVDDITSTDKRAVEMRPGMWEQALFVCAAFNWPRMYKTIRGRIAYLCRPEVAEDGVNILRCPMVPRGTGDETTRAPLDANVCGQETIEAIIDARNSIIPDLARNVARMYGVLCNNTIEWPCENETCNVNRRGALTDFMLLTGMFDVNQQGVFRAKEYVDDVESSLWEMVTKVSPVWVNEEDETQPNTYRPELKRWAGTCNQCWGVPGESSSFLTPVETLLVELSTWQVKAKLAEAVVVPGPREKAEPVAVEDAIVFQSGERQEGGATAVEEPAAEESEGEDSEYVQSGSEEDE